MFSNKTFLILAVLTGLFTLVACSKGEPSRGATSPDNSTAQAPQAVSSAKRMPSDPSLKSLYIQSCYGCHSSGAAGAPKSGNKEQWALRTQKGLDTLLANTKNGLNSMPPKGMCMNCSDDDFRALILFLSGEAE
ncbi:MULTISPECIES: c-type cytochrome [Zhongshania]|jgi:cytochrome c5|uniref:Cytochrome c5 n=1 Tax=Zhongshania antarctica TaxID=641702 RepID=A0A840R5V9_9GAMM|nr:MULTISPECIES: c-type cytochrome [Zhongshania]MBB5187886.1 cytochrome c5 [Zhongshania antarctica]